jgi:hypothetical protein
MDLTELWDLGLGVPESGIDMDMSMAFFFDDLLTTAPGTARDAALPTSEFDLLSGIEASLFDGIGLPGGAREQHVAPHTCDPANKQAELAQQHNSLMALAASNPFGGGLPPAAQQPRSGSSPSPWPTAQLLGVPGTSVQQQPFLGVGSMDGSGTQPPGDMKSLLEMLRSTGSAAPAAQHPSRLPRRQQQAAAAPPRAQQQQQQRQQQQGRPGAAPRRGASPATDDADADGQGMTTQEKNRTAQQRFRMRQKAKITAMEQQVAELTSQLERAATDNSSLKSLNNVLEQVRPGDGLLLRLPVWCQRRVQGRRLPGRAAGSRAPPAPPPFLPPAPPLTPAPCPPPPAPQIPRRCSTCATSTSAGCRRRWPCSTPAASALPRTPRHPAGARAPRRVRAPPGDLDAPGHHAAALQLHRPRHTRTPPPAKLQPCVALPRPGQAARQGQA